MPRPDFSNIELNLERKKAQISERKWMSPEQIEIKENYYSKDIHDTEHIGFISGIAPNLRGPYASMYVTRPWTIRQYAGFSTAEESNAVYG